MKWIITLALAVCGVAASGTAAAAPAIVLELFTSNSCSSCPPAYRMLENLRVDSAAGPVRLIRLDEHVDYWNSLGWVDRYSAARFTRRQQHYARDVFGANRVYTPQLVVNGSRELIGSDADRARAAVRAAAAAPSLSVKLTVTERDARQIRLGIEIDQARVTAVSRLWVALTQDRVVSRVGAGENGGRILHEDGVVRALRPVATLVESDRATQHPYSARLALPRGVAVDALHAVVFVQRNDTHAIIGAASQDL